MAGCNIKKSQVFFASPPLQAKTNVFEINDRAVGVDKPYFAFGEFVYMSGYPFSKDSDTGFTVNDLVEG